jgi:predicted kinase
MPKPLLIIITGLPCTGKTTLGRRIASEFHMPFLNKDSIKELLFDSLGWSDREWSKKLGLASYVLLYYFLDIQLKAGISIIVESNFHPTFDIEKFLALLEKYDFQPLQIMCQTEGTILFQRFKVRAESGERHPGHVDALSYEEFKAVLLRGKLDPLALGGTVIEVDTTDFSKSNYEGLYEAIRSSNDSRR